MKKFASRYSRKWNFYSIPTRNLYWKFKFERIAIDSSNKTATKNLNKNIAHKNYLIMPRNAAAKKGSKEDYQKQFPGEIYEKLQLSRKVVCYNYWKHLTTAGFEGWDSESAGSIFHWKTSSYLIENIPRNSFNKLGKVRFNLKPPIETKSINLISPNSFYCV